VSDGEVLMARRIWFQICGREEGMAKFSFHSQTECRNFAAF